MRCRANRTINRSEKGGRTDSTIAPPKTRDFFNERRMVLDTRDDALKKKLRVFPRLRGAIERSHRRGEGAPYCRRRGRELVSKPAISLSKRWGGYHRTTRTLSIVALVRCFVINYLVVTSYSRVLPAVPVSHATEPRRAQHIYSHAARHPQALMDQPPSTR